MPVSIFVGRAPDQSSRLVLGAVLGKLGAGRPLPPPARDPAQRPRHAGAVLAAGARCATSSPRTCRPSARVRKTLARAARALPPHPRGGHRPGPVDAPPAGRPRARRRAGAQGRHHRPGPPRQQRSTRTPGRRRTPSPGRSPPTIRNPVVRSLSFMLHRFWNRIYDGVTVHHLDKLKQVAPGHEVVYVPCHRSHMDYLLLSYLLYPHGIVPPHIAAGDQPQPAGDRPAAAQGRRVLPAPQHPRQRAVLGGVLRIRRAAGRRAASRSSTSSRAGARAPAACCRPRAA